MDEFIVNPFGYKINTLRYRIDDYVNASNVLRSEKELAASTQTPSLRSWPDIKKRWAEALTNGSYMVGADVLLPVSDNDPIATTLHNSGVCRFYETELTSTTSEDTGRRIDNE